MEKEPRERLSTALIEELTVADVAIPKEMARQLAQDLVDERKRSSRYAACVLQFRREIEEFMIKHEIRESARDLMATQTGIGEGSQMSTVYSPLDGSNLTTPIVWLRDILAWATTHVRR